MRHALGIDLGGTKILAGVIDLERGKVLSTAKQRSQVDQGPDELLARLVETSREAIQAAKGVRPEAVGIGAPGQIDYKRGVLILGPNLGQHMDNLPLASLLGKRLDLPVTLGNDVQVAAVGEHRFGAGKGHDDFMCVFVGSGIGGAIVQGGKLRLGASNTAGEIGHIVVDVGGRLCGCGGQGHLEAYASRSSVVRAILSSIRAGRESVLREAVSLPLPETPSGTALRSKAIAKAVAEGDALTLEAIADAARYLGAGLVSAINFYNPGRIILGGGFVDAVDLLFVQAEARARAEALMAAGRSVEIVRSALGDDAGIMGAAVLASGG